jgi:23S rRNA (pseudouridine1915-N3)-methyltransferase
MIIKIISVGKKQSDYHIAIAEYQKRLSASQKLDWIFIPPSSFNAQQARLAESVQILAKLRPNDVVWLLDERGEQISSPGLAAKLNVLQNQAVQSLVIIIGGAYGVDDSLRQRANWVWSLGQLVYPHQIVRLILAEQLYRAQQINSGTAYHHA